MVSRRLIETLAMLLIGDSVLTLVSPRRHVSLWLGGPRWWDGTFEPLVRRPGLSRLLGVAGVGLGLWLAWRQEPPVRPAPVSRGRRWARQMAEAMQ